MVDHNYGRDFVVREIRDINDFTPEELHILKIARSDCGGCCTPDAYRDRRCLECYAYADAREEYLKNKIRIKNNVLEEKA